jgi:PadR family transcriptional regulator PadR
MDAQMKKGILEMCILYQMKGRKLYGYELMKAIREAFPDVYEGSIYTILRRLNGEGYTEITLQESPSGPARKYYCITPQGGEYLEKMIVEWQYIVRSVSCLGIPPQTGNN